MIALEELLRSADIRPCTPVRDNPEITSLTDNSRKVGPGTLFVAIRGTAVDAHQFLGQAAEQGAVALVIEHDFDGQLPELPVVCVENTRQALGRLAHAFHGHPTREMTCCAVTGSNGKSTVAQLLEAVLKAAGREPALVGTIFVRFGDTVYPATQTTPGPLTLAAHAAEMRAAGIDALALEVSSHGLDQDRVAGIEFDCAILTNVTPEHLDYHGTMADYAAAKKRLFDQYVAADGWRVINLDDPTGREWVGDRRNNGRAAPELVGKTLTYGRADDADVRLLSASATLAGIELVIAARDQQLELHSPLKGAFNISNLLAAAAGGLALGFTPGQIRHGLESVAAV
ncbi:Mur ligase family protein, partial [Candidatus Sumerlaeota bacterium]